MAFDSSTENLAKAIKAGRVLAHCPTCSELVNSMTFITFSDLTEPSPWPGYSYFGRHQCYCPHCDQFLDAWYRCHDNDYRDAELDVTPWSRNQESGRWEAKGRLFGRERSRLSEDQINETIEEHKWLICGARFHRKLSGPRYIKDERRFSVSIPLPGRSAVDGKMLLGKISAKLRAWRDGSLERSEEIDSVLWGHFQETLRGADYTMKLWKDGHLPVDLCVWCYNDGHRYQYQLYDHDTGGAFVHPSLAAASAS